MIARGHRTSIDRPGTGLLVVIDYLLWKDAAGTGRVDERDDDYSQEDDAPFLAPAGADSSGDD